MIRSDVINYLSQLQDDLATFNPDQIEMVQQYLHKTDLKTALVGILGNMRMDLIQRSDETLTRTFTVMKDDLIAHIGTRIARLQNPLTSEQSDPWIAVEVGTNDAALQQRCCQASTHINDLLFSCDEVARHRLERGCPIEAAEVHAFRNDSLPRYLKIITTLPQRTQQALEVGFTSLEESLRGGDYAKALQTTSEIRSTLGNISK